MLFCFYHLSFISTVHHIAKKNLHFVHSVFIICLYLCMSNKQKQEIMTTREFIKAGMVNNGTKVMVNKGARYECGRQSDHNIVDHVRESFEATCISTPEISIHSNGIQDFEYAHLTCVDTNGVEYCIDISHCKYSNVDMQKNVTILI